MALFNEWANARPELFSIIHFDGWRYRRYWLCQQRRGDGIVGGRTTATQTWRYLRNFKRGSEWASTHWVVGGAGDRLADQKQAGASNSVHPTWASAAARFAQNAPLTRAKGGRLHAGCDWATFMILNIFFHPSPKRIHIVIFNSKQCFL